MQAILMSERGGASVHCSGKFFYPFRRLLRIPRIWNAVYFHIRILLASLKMVVNIHALSFPLMGQGTTCGPENGLNYLCHFVRDISFYLLASSYLEVRACK